MRLYLDVSCLNRPFDDQRQTRIRLEAEAIAEIMARTDRRRDTILSSEIVQVEIEAMNDPERRRRVQALLPAAAQTLRLSRREFQRADDLRRLGFKPADALHVAAAESLSADVLLSCDDRMCRAALRNARRLRVRILNPVEWLRELPDAPDTR